ncbi:hypothetical protein THAOC_26723, partial [Thalassiosira oceanica]
MTSTDTGVELACAYGDVLKRVLTRIWNLRISHPDKEIVLHTSDVKSCFRQLKHHPSVAGAFSYILGDFLFIPVCPGFRSGLQPAKLGGHPPLSRAPGRTAVPRQDPPRQAPPIPRPPSFRAPPRRDGGESRPGYARFDQH